MTKKIIKKKYKPQQERIDELEFKETDVSISSICTRQKNETIKEYGKFCLYISLMENEPAFAAQMENWLSKKQGRGFKGTLIPPDWTKHLYYKHKWRARWTQYRARRLNFTNELKLKSEIEETNAIIAERKLLREKNLNIAHKIYNTVMSDIDEISQMDNEEDLKRYAFKLKKLAFLHGKNNSMNMVHGAMKNLITDEVVEKTESKSISGITFDL